MFINKIPFIKAVYLSVAFLFVAFVLLAISTNVPTDLTQDDLAVFKDLGLNTPSASLTFEAELLELAHLQKETFRHAPFGIGIPPGQSREPLDLIRAGQGLCYDRSRTIDKAATFLGFQARHVFLLYKQDKSFLSAITSRRQNSHAVT